jgi:ribosomal protein S18 acetylase RimI-like enzyme
MPHADFKSIRPATIDDVRDIARIQVETWRSAYRGIISDEYLAGLSIEKRTEGWTRMISEAATDTLVIQKDGQTLGWISFGCSRDEDRKGQAEVYAIYLDDAQRGKGLGRLLMAEAEAKLAAKLPTATQVSLWVLEPNTAARGFYERIGYQNQSHKPITLGKESFCELRYEKPLTCS